MVEKALVVWRLRLREARNAVTRQIRQLLPNRELRPFVIMAIASILGAVIAFRANALVTQAGNQWTSAAKAEALRDHNFAVHANNVLVLQAPLMVYLVEPWSWSERFELPSAASAYLFRLRSRFLGKGFGTTPPIVLATRFQRGTITYASTAQPSSILRWCPSPGGCHIPFVSHRSKRLRGLRWKPRLGHRRHRNSHS